MPHKWSDRPRETRRRAHRRHYLKRLKERRCVQCGKPAQESYVHCAPCREAARKRHLAWTMHHKPSHNNREWATPQAKIDWLCRVPNFLTDLEAGLYTYEIEFRDLARQAREAGLYARNTKIPVVADSLLKYSRRLREDVSQRRQAAG
jgi:hypothetical protein